MTNTTATIDWVEQFQDEGYVILRNLIPPQIVEAVKDDMKRLVDQHARRLLEANKISNPLPEEPFETRLARLYANNMDLAPLSFRQELHLPGLFGLFFHPPLLDAVERILGPEIRLYPNYTVRPKLPDHKGTEVLWHQDGGYTETVKSGGNVDELRMMNVWTPLVPASVENGCMQFVPGTHKLGVVPHQKKRHYLEIASEYLEPRRRHAINIELDPGDVVLFNNLLFHAGLPNRSGKIRWSADWRYQDATQPTLRPEQGHIARSRSNPGNAVKTAEHWTQLSFA